MRKTRDPTAAFPVATLLGHRHVEMGVQCLGSLLRCSADPLRLRVHDDGTLTSQDLERLGDALAEPELVPREVADARVAEILNRRPALRAFRERNPLALKLIDVPILATGEDLAYCDSDVLFLRPFRDLFRPPSGEAAAVFMSDRQNAYSIRSWHLLIHRRLTLPCRINTGLLRFQIRYFDPDLLEWYLARPEFGFAPVWVEQTAWALLGQRAGCRLWDPRRIRLAQPGEQGLEDAVALHFVSPARELLPRFLERAADRTGEPPVELKTVAAKRCRPWDLAWTEVRRRVTRLQHPSRTLDA